VSFISRCDAVGAVVYWPGGRICGRKADCNTVFWKYEMRGCVRNWFKIAAGVFGAALCVAGLWYLLDFVSNVDFGKHLGALDRGQILAVVGLTLCLTVANTLIGLSWKSILSDFGGVISTRRAQLIFSQANLGKYVPGNVLHMLGRQVLAMREGVPALASAKSLTIETVLLALTSACFAVVVWLASRYVGFGSGSALLVACLSAGGVAMVLHRFGMTGSAYALLGHFAYHLTGGVVFAFLFFLLQASSAVEADFWLLVMAYVASWGLGLLTPGAPAGLGVREAALIALLQQGVSDHTTLAAAVVVSRCMSVVADLSYFCTLRICSLIVVHSRR
jgi:uncharacterized membrane protein YbhN (UPF0104 family)